MSYHGRSPKSASSGNLALIGVGLLVGFGIYKIVRALAYHEIALRHGRILTFEAHPILFSIFTLALIAFVVIMGALVLYNLKAIPAQDKRVKRALEARTLVDNAIRSEMPSPDSKKQDDKTGTGEP